MPDYLSLLKETFIVNIDHTLAQIAVTILVYYYGSRFVKKFLRHVPLSKINKFIFFIVIILFGISFVALSLIGLILSVSDIFIKWVIIILLLVWSFIKFDKFIAKEQKK